MSIGVWDVFKQFQQGRPVVPLHLLAVFDYVFALESAYRDHTCVSNAELPAKCLKFLLHSLKNILVVACQVHFVHGSDDMVNSQKR